MARLSLTLFITLAMLAMAVQLASTQFHGESTLQNRAASNIQQVGKGIKKLHKAHEKLEKQQNDQDNSDSSDDSGADDVDNGSIIGNNGLFISNQANNDESVVNGHTLTEGVNTIDGQVYTKTKGYLLGPTVTSGPDMHLTPQMTSAFGCVQMGNGAMQAGDCSNVESRIQQALASITSSDGSQRAQVTPTRGDEPLSLATAQMDAAPARAAELAWSLAGLMAVGASLLLLL